MRYQRLFLCTLAAVVAIGCASSAPKVKENPYADYVWPPPPDEARIQLIDILHGRADVEGESRVAKALIGVDPTGQFDRLRKPFGAAIDVKGRILITDTELGVLVRFDRTNGIYDVFGTTGAVTLSQPMGLAVAEDGRIFVTDGTQRIIVCYSDDGDVLGVFGSSDDLKNPTGVALAPDQKRIFVADPKGHRIVVYDIASGKLVNAFGKPGEGPGEFAFPTALEFGPEGNLWVVDQLNSRVQIFTEDGQFFDEFGDLHVGYGGFVRPKDLAIAANGMVFVTDAAFNNAQLYDIDLQLLTFVGSFGMAPGQFRSLSGIAVRGQEFVMVDQLNRRIQLFQFLVPMSGE